MECVFEKTLRYTAPSHGDWGIVRIASLVPESHTVFVCPFACGRHGALGAIAQGFKERLSYIFITKEDIIKGYDQTILEGVDELLERLKKRPRAVMVYVSCLDDLIGTDLNALMEQLHQNHPDISFRAGHMNPISLESDSPPAMTTQDAMFGFLKKSDIKRRNLNLMGNLLNIDDENELRDALKSAGMEKVLHMSDFNTFDGFQEMAQSSFNLVLSPIALLAARSTKQRHGIPFLFLPVSYDTGEIADQYIRLQEFVGQTKKYDFSLSIQKACGEIQKTLDLVGQKPLVVSAGAAVRPFSLAAALIRYGFRVAAVVAQEVLPIDREGFEEVRRSAPGIKVIQPEHPDMIRFQNRMEDAVAIGFDAAYITGSRHIVNLSGDGGMFGYYGVYKLMKMIAKACLEESDLKKLIADYGVVI
jgi:nitrogenase molybdenum-cofactor synthesis protein NifE